MNSVTLELDEQCYQPGEKVTGRATWSGDPSPERVEVRLFWVTSGAALSQVGIVNRCIVKNPRDRRSTSFEFILPEGPWSFAGRLVSLRWAVEAVAFPSRASAISFITLGPDKRRINPFREEEAEAERHEFE
jgi:hypothetical protein